MLKSLRWPVVLDKMHSFPSDIYNNFALTAVFEYLVGEKKEKYNESLWNSVFKK